MRNFNSEDFLGCLGLMIIMVAMIYAYCKLTPNQMSGEYDQAYADGVRAGLIEEK